MMQIPDPIHGYIELDGMFAHIVNTPEFQRLRSVEQGSFRPVYPGARHDRFAHSLGTYHLAKKFAEPFFRNLANDAGVVLPAEEQELLTRTFLYAALLHDIGHAPFSHTTEGYFEEPKGANNLPVIWHDLCKAVNQVNSHEGTLFAARDKKCGAPHEIMSATILVEQWENFHVKPKNKPFVPEVDLPLAARMVIGFTYRPEDLKELTDQDVVTLGVRNCLIQMINYSLLDVDRLDYMGRDALMSGFVNARLDLDCLAQSVTAASMPDAWVLWKDKTRPVLENDPSLRVRAKVGATLLANQEIVLPEKAVLVGDNALDQDTAFDLAQNVPGLALKEGDHIALTRSGGIVLRKAIRVKLPKGTELKVKAEPNKKRKLARTWFVTLAVGTSLRPDDVVEVNLVSPGVERLSENSKKTVTIRKQFQLRPTWLAPAYRDAALRVFDLMFQAKLSHDAWVLANPAGAYDAALLAHCIRQLNNRIDPKYMETVFTAKALSRDGLHFAGKHYRLLSDVDVAADLKAQSGHPFDELHTRELSMRRIAAWRSYYEYHHIFNCPEMGLTPEKVYDFFEPLMKHLEEQKILVFDEAAYKDIAASNDVGAIRAAKLLKDFLVHAPEEEDPGYNVVLLDRTSNFTMKLDPADIRIVFSDHTRESKHLPLRSGRYNYSTYGDMTGITGADKRSKPYFYIMRHYGLGHVQLKNLRELLAEELKK